MNRHRGDGGHLHFDDGRSPSGDRVTERNPADPERIASAGDGTMISLLHVDLIRAGGNAPEVDQAIGSCEHQTQRGHVDRDACDRNSKSRPDPHRQLPHVRSGGKFSPVVP